MRPININYSLLKRVESKKIGFSFVQNTVLFKNFLIMGKKLNLYNIKCIRRKNKQRDGIFLLKSFYKKKNLVLEFVTYNQLHSGNFKN